MDDADITAERDVAEAPLRLAASHRASGKYEANIGISVAGKKRKKYLGLFDTDAEAHAAYVAAKRELHAGNTL